ncbi:MAG TPA: MurR/RpiR family transcriptional regulator [Candidatus Saccharicenans sp.]|jgi:DNA-binding MurR/RpiR family transcriptional regulator|nr:MurR/RpiR family transcriptional regulator [Candidatus Saccharicenans sp.]HRD01054.1 MurR/RpiR family transcriptional regulator [Candidatus Saccharicenans sp.]
MNKNARIPLRELILSRYSSFSGKEKKVADYILQNSHVAFALPINSLAEQADVSSATIVRFSQRLGFSGFQELKSQIIEEVKEEINPEERFKLLVPDNNAVETVIKVAENEVKNINLTIDNIVPQNFKEFIERLRQSSCVNTLGIGISSILARLAAYLLNQAGLKTQFLQKEEHYFEEKLINLNKKEAILAFSFPPYSKETISAVKFCYERGLTCLSISDKPTAPIIKYSHSFMTVSTKNIMFTNSIGAVVVLLNAIATDIAFLNKKKVVLHLDLLNQLEKNGFLA